DAIQFDHAISEINTAEIGFGIVARDGRILQGDFALFRHPAQPESADNTGLERIAIAGVIFQNGRLIDEDGRSDINTDSASHISGRMAGKQTVDNLHAARTARVKSSPAITREVV